MNIECKRYFKKSVVAACLVLGGVIYGQESVQLIDLGIGYEPDGYVVRGAYSKLYGNHLVTLGGQIHVESYDIGGGVQQELNAQLYLANLEYHYEILNHNGRSFVASVGGGGTIGYENIDQIPLTEGNILNQESGVIYGGVLDISVEKYLMELSSNSALALVANLRQYYFIDAALGDTQFNVILGFRYIF